MIKYIGAAVLLSACIMAGHLRYRGKKAALEQMRSFGEALQLLRAELKSCDSPLSDALKRVADSCTGCGAELARQLHENMDRLGVVPFGILWQQACRENLPYLPAELLESAEGLGRVLGRYETGEQLRAIDRLITALESELSMAALHLSSDRRLSLGLSAAIGLMLVIVLL